MRRVIALCTTLAATPLLADGMREADRDRYERFEAIFGMAMRQALALGDAVDVGLLTAALGGAAQPGLDPSGDWLCRWMKLGDTTPLVVYSNFDCRITEDGDGWRLEKLTGSQRFTGRLSLHDDGWLYTGVAFVGDAPATDYAGLPPGDQTPVEPNQTTAQIGLFQQVSEVSARLLLPDPVLESDFDVISLSR